MPATIGRDEGSGPGGGGGGIGAVIMAGGGGIGADIFPTQARIITKPYKKESIARKTPGEGGARVQNFAPDG